MMPRVCLVWLFPALLLAGCSGASYKTAPVSGQVKLDGKPVPNAQVTFVPVQDPAKKEPLPSSSGITDSDGRYTLVLNSGSKANGALVGKHKVIIVLVPNQSVSLDEKSTFHKNLPPRYNRNTVLECDVPAGGRDDANFLDLKMN
jgi:hypothetical protein